MRLTETLLGYLNSPFNKDPQPFLALRIAYTGGTLTWKVEDGRLFTFIAGEPNKALSIDLSQHTIQSLVTAITAVAGYTVPFYDLEHASLGAITLIDTGLSTPIINGAGTSSNDDHIYAYTALLWIWLEAMAEWLNTIRLDIEEMLIELRTATKGARGFWQEFWAGYFAVFRKAGETDAGFHERVKSEVLAIRSNNKALEKFIKVNTGYAARVVDIAPNYVTFKTNTVGHKTNTIGFAIGPPTVAQNALLAQLGLPDIPLWGDGTPLTRAFAVIFDDPTINTVQQSVRDTIRATIDRNRMAGTVPLYFMPGGGILKTNTVGDKTNTLGEIIGPGSKAYIPLLI